MSMKIRQSLEMKYLSNEIMFKKGENCNQHITVNIKRQLLPIYCTVINNIKNIRGK